MLQPSTRGLERRTAITHLSQLRNKSHVRWKIGRVEGNGIMEQDESLFWLPALNMNTPQLHIHLRAHPEIRPCSTKDVPILPNSKLSLILCIARIACLTRPV